MNNPGFLSILMVVFILLGVYNIFSGLRKQREARARGQRVAWYRQINLLTGLEYLLLSIVFMLSLNLRSNTIPNALRGLVVPFYLVVLLSAAVLAGFVIRQAITNARGLTKNPTMQGSSNAAATQAVETTVKEVTPAERAANIQRRRARRQKAAAARRRQSGRT